MLRPAAVNQSILTGEVCDMFPCPHCDASFSNESELYGHALDWHSIQKVAELIGGSFMPLTKDNFRQIDSQWIYAIGGFHLSITPNRNGDFSLHVYGSIEPIPNATQYPTEPEWERALYLANKFVDAYMIAVDREKG